MEKKKQSTHVMSLRLPRKLYTELDQMALERNTTRTALILQMLSRGITLEKKIEERLFAEFEREAKRVGYNGGSGRTAETNETTISDEEVDR